MRKILILLLLGAAIFVLGGIGGVFFNTYLPNIASLPFLRESSLFKKLSERVTIINKTEQVVIQEDGALEKIVSQPATAVATIIVVPTDNKNGKGEVKTMTGVLLTNDGLLVTYSEKPVMASEAHFSVLLFDGSNHSADFAQYDQFSNLLYLRINDGTNTPAIALANSDDARVGKKLIAIGNASVEYQDRLALGILSTIDHTFNLSGKTVSSSEKLEGVFEVDAPVFGNFIGGPAVGFNGEMVGLVGTLTMDNTTHIFLIPANVVHASLDREIAGNLAERPVFGAYYLSITKSLALQMGLGRDHGALIYSPSGKTSLALLVDSKAMKANLQAGDIIEAINGKEITPENSFSSLLEEYQVGDTVELLVFQNGSEKKISVQL